LEVKPTQRVRRSTFEKKGRPDEPDGHAEEEGLDVL